MSTKAKSISVDVRTTGEDDGDDLREAEEQLHAGRTLNEALSIFACELEKRLQEPEENDVEQQPPQFSLVWELLYYHPKVYVKGAIVLLFVVVLTLLLALEAHLMLTATWSLLGGLVVVSVISTEIAKRVRQRRERRHDPDDLFVRQRRCRTFEAVKSFTKEDAGEYDGAGSYVILALFAAFGACSVFVVDDETTSLAFLVLFGVFGLILVLLIGFHAWSKTLGVESYIIVEALFDIVLASQLSASNTAEIAYNATTIVLASIATVCTLVRLGMRWNKKERESERILLAAFLITDAADVVLLASQLFLNSSCDLDPKIVVVAGLLALNPCVTELSAAFKSDKEKEISRDIQRLLQDPKRDEDKLHAMQEQLFEEQAKRRRMENKSIVQTIVVGLGAFPIVYALSLVERETNWYWIFVPIIVLIVYVIDSKVFHYAYSRTVLNIYFYAASFRLFSALWALLLALTPVYADAINCNESTAFIIWSLYSVVALLVVTVIKSLQREALLTPMGREKYEDLVPKILRPARADLASYYVDKLDGARGDVEVRESLANKLVKLFVSVVRSGRDKPLAISSLLDVMAYVVEYAKNVVVDDNGALSSATDFARLFWKYYAQYDIDDEPYNSFRSSLERAVTTLALSNDVEVLEKVVRVVRALVASTSEDEDTIVRRLRSFAAMLNVRRSVLDEVLGRYERAKVLAEVALQIAKDTSEDETDDTTVATYLNNLALLLKAQGKLAEAEPLYRQALAIDKKVYGAEHHEVATDLNNLAGLSSAQGKYDDAEPLYREALAIDKKVYGNEHPAVATTLNNLAQLLKDQGKLSEAEPLMREAFAISKKALGAEHPTVAIRLNNLALLLKAQGKLDEALTLYYEALAIEEKVIGKEHPSYALQLNNIAEMLRTQGKLDDAKPLYEEAFAIFKKVLGEEHPNVATLLNNLAELLRNQGKLAEAEPLYRQVMVILEKSVGKEHPNYASTLNNLALLLYTQGKLSEAEPLMREAMRIRKKTLGEQHPLYASDLNNLAMLLWNQGKKQEARSKGKEALRIAEKVLGKDHPTTQICRRNWG